MALSTKARAGVELVIVAAIACGAWCLTAPTADAQQPQRRQPVRWMMAAPVQGACRIINGVRVCPQQARQRQAMQVWRPPMAYPSVPQYYQQMPPVYFRGGW